mmetsp:Transcript_16130/g.45663  ORF Transcript_16130/g.45663 Transcript_16130/m.45663 type:complete len:219 (+) Transcript_16130:455-1111(+)
MSSPARSKPASSRSRPGARRARPRPKLKPSAAAPSTGRPTTPRSSTAAAPRCTCASTARLRRDSSWPSPPSASKTPLSASRPPTPTCPSSSSRSTTPSLAPSPRSSSPRPSSTSWATPPGTSKRTSRTRAAAFCHGAATCSRASSSARPICSALCRSWPSSSTRSAAPPSTLLYALSRACMSSRSTTGRPRRLGPRMLSCVAATARSSPTKSRPLTSS